ncbi:hypothetical protein E8E14_000738 [Neopestalotiopsis sp. 37M]|nr:hypothetical protein E8E14_000738 [Neopestalotiopsis sp. 37M]
MPCCACCDNMAPVEEEPYKLPWWGHLLGWGVPLGLLAWVIWDAVVRSRAWRALEHKGGSRLIISKSSTTQTARLPFEIEKESEDSKDKPHRGKDTKRGRSKGRVDKESDAEDSKDSRTGKRTPDGADPRVESTRSLMLKTPRISPSNTSDSSILQEF